MSDFLVPDLGEGLQDATITGWAVAVGDVVELNQPLCTVETNKAEVEIPSPYAGRIVELGGAEGETLAVGTLLVRIDTGPVEPVRTPVLVGYGTDNGMDRSRRPRAAPKVRKLAADLAVDLSGLQPGSGTDGIITREDVLGAASTPADTLVVRGAHARMATQMALSRSRIPDAHASVQVDCSALLRLRDRLDVTPFVLTLRMLLIALGRHPLLNATWVDGDGGAQIRLHSDVRLGIAVASERGLVVPVIADAHRLTTRRLAAAVEQLVGKARNGSLSPAELGNSTFTVSNFGALGLDEGVPVINYPEAAILGVGSLRPRAVVIDDEVVARPTMTLTCAFDHRVADGAQVAAFLTDLRGLIEAPEIALLDC
ncbi:2-oxo acid dehydrogenase subunit E2 [Mycolicibacterium sp. CH28]|uniref:dihydrolipoamide acetyltransferase family protein n=1 Tax=Mycolicibacterium sp. CH28 TaxID=2512237 RepID=UPI00108018BC|nr:dihydrolipoamide acetyltransferase family protein [Mycolicibacterium sp. CH28]TGD85159.1 2-oxo acid dehydrogenase subunit E2 [Mycolicibacterium sp. CH28]